MFRKYYELGFSVIPVVGKATYEKEWSRWCVERQPEKLIDAYEARYKLPQYGIGLCLGPASGLVALDVDSESQDILDFVAATVPPSPVRKRGSKGYTAFYRPGKGIATANAFRKNQGRNKKDIEGIEVLYTGRQTVLPPSYNPDAERPYTWITPDSLESVTIADLPVLELSHVNACFEYIKKFPQAGYTRDTGAELGPGRNNRLTILACAMLCSEPYETDERLAEKIYNLDRQEHPTNPYFSDTNEQENQRAKGNASLAALLFIKRHRKQLDRKGVISSAVPVSIDVRTAFKKVQEPVFPESRGLIGEIKNAIMRINRSGGQDELATGAAIAICSTFASNRFHIEGRAANTAQFIMCVARSGKGKGAAVKIAEGLFFHELLRGMNLRGLSNYSSVAAFVEHLPSQRTRLDIIDEFGSVLKGFSGQSDLKKELEGLLCSIYSNGAAYFVGHNTKGQNRQGACFSPSVSLFANVQEDILVKHGTNAMLQSGFLSRFLYFSAKEGTPFNPGYLDAIDLTPIAEKCREVFPYNGIEAAQPDGSIVTDIGMVEPRREGLCFAEGVKAYREGIDDWFYRNEQQTLEQGDKVTSTFLTRQFEMADKLAVTNAVCMGRRVIQKDDYDYACSVIKACMARAGSFLKEMASETPFEKRKQRIFNMIAKGQPMRRTMLIKNSNLTRKELNEVLEALRDSALIAEGNENGNAVYIAAGQGIDA